MEHETNSNIDANSDADEEPDSNDEFGDNADDESGDDAENDDGNSGWADAFAKVLQQEKPKNKKYLVLSKAKKFANRKGKDGDNQPTFEILTKEGENNAGQVTAETETKPTTEELEWAAIARKEKNNKLQELRVVPSAMDFEREKSFKRIAQKGVVQLFNAVRAQHRDLVDQLEKAGPLDHKRDAVLNNINKRKFLDMLMGSKRAKSENVDNPIKSEDATDEPNKPSQWSVLKDDFMTNKNTSSHWDESGDEDNGINDDDGGDSESS